jgi:predicted dehydrogenase
MSKKIGVGIIGTGRRGYELAVCMAKLRSRIDLEVRGLNNRTSARMHETKQSLGVIYGESGGTPSIALYEHYEDLIADPNIELIMILTPNYAHKDPTVKALNSGKRVYLDKPLAHNLDDSLAICREQKRTNNPLIMSFTRRYERPWIRTYELVKQGLIGDLKMILVRDVIPYHVYFHTWARRMDWSGGPLAGKMSHIFDVYNWFTQDTPSRVSAFGGQSVFKADPNAPECCSRCDRECPYRVEVGKKSRQDDMVDFATSRLAEKEIIKRHDNCVWLPGADIDDHGVISIEYSSGIKTSLFWSVFGPDSEDQETMELVGDKGRIRLIRHGGVIDIVTDYGKRREVLDERKGDFQSSHFGADDAFIFDLDQFCKGGTPRATSKEGLLAARMTEAALRSMRAGGQLVRIEEIEDVKG